MAVSRSRPRRDTTAELDGVSYKLAYAEDWDGNGPYALIEYYGAASRWIRQIRKECC